MNQPAYKKVTFDLAPLSPYFLKQLERNVRGWAKRKSHCIVWGIRGQQYPSLPPKLVVNFVDGTMAQCEKATNSLRSIVRHQKELQAAQRRILVAHEQRSSNKSEKAG